MNFGAPGLARFAVLGDPRDLDRTFRDLYGQVRRSLDHAKGAAHRGRTDTLHRLPLVGVARRHEKAFDVAAEAFLELRVGDGRAQHLRQLARDQLARELQRCQGLVHPLAADQGAHQPGLLRRRANALRRGSRFDHLDALPLRAG